MTRALLLAVGTLLTPIALSAQAASHDAAMHAAHHPAADSAFAAMQTRGATVMGVDQQASVHQFTATPTGGVIRFTMKDPTDSAGTAAIRRHLRDVTRAFARGDFRMPMAVHDTLVPGTAVMRQERHALGYALTEVPGGGEVRITATSVAARRAVQEFLAYQTQDHRTDTTVTR